LRDKGRSRRVMPVSKESGLCCEGLSAATKLNTARLINEDIMCTAECTGDYNMMDEITEQMLN
jgi:hypothetical protein